MDAVLVTVSVFTKEICREYYSHIDTAASISISALFAFMLWKENLILARVNQLKEFEEELMTDFSFLVTYRAWICHLLTFTLSVKTLLTIDQNVKVHCLKKNWFGDNFNISLIYNLIHKCFLCAILTWTAVNIPLWIFFYKLAKYIILTSRLLNFCIKKNIWICYTKL